MFFDLAQVWISTVLVAENLRAKTKRSIFFLSDPAKLTVFTQNEPNWSSTACAMGRRGSPLELFLGT